MHDIELTSQPDELAGAEKNGIPGIPHQMAVLPNGLTLIVHEDRRYPLVCTQLRFNVGSKDEPAGRTGFAHLFEHLMFKESENRQGNWHRMLQSMGGIGVNGTTNLDRTNYYQTVPTAALDQLLWMESDRMGNLLGGIDATTLADEVAVVKNEKRQREGAPYGGVFEAITTALYPREHPYGHTVLGSFEDLDNANLETVADWHARWYGASNAVLVLSGDIGFEEALAKVEHWFGAMPTGTPVRRATQWLPEIRDTKRITLYDRVPFRRIYSVWSTPGGLDPDSTLLQIVGRLLSGGIYSRLYRRLVEGERLCMSISAAQDERQVCSEFHIVATLAPGSDPAAVDAAISEELGRFIEEGPTQEELDRIRSGGRRSLLRLLDSIGQITDLLAANQLLYGRPDGHLEHIHFAEQATPEMIRAAAEKWLSHKALELDVRPFEAVGATHDPANRVGAPPVGEIHAPVFPKSEYAKLDNGLSIQLCRQAGTQGANFVLYMQSGARFDPAGVEGLSSNTLAVMDAGTANYTRVQLAETFAERGINYGVGVQHEHATLSMDSLKEDAGDAMAIMAEILLRPAFPESEIRPFLDRAIMGAKAPVTSPGAAAGRVLGKLVFGATHDYGKRVTASTLEAITLDLIRQRHQAWLDPAKATLLMVGDFTLDEAVRMADAAFGEWSPSGATMPMRDSIWMPSPGRYHINRRGSGQSALRIAMASPEIQLGMPALGIFNSLFGGSFSSRLNANLRERRGWTYDANSSFAVYPQIGSFSIGSDVQADRTLDALAEIEAELAALKTDRPITSDEIEEARHGMLVGLPSAWAGNGAIMGALIERLVYNLPEDHHDNIEREIRSVTAADLETVVELVGDPDAYSWIVSGDPEDVAGAAFETIEV